MLSQLASATKSVVRIVLILSMAYLFLPITASAQFPWTEDFNNNSDEGVYGGCSTAPTSCAYYSAPTEGTLSGDFDDIANSSDWFYIYQCHSALRKYHLRQPQPRE